jgi:hypothetical protein
MLQGRFDLGHSTLQVEHAPTRSRKPGLPLVRR